MLDTQKQMIKKALTENLPAPTFINLHFKGCIGGWERNLSDMDYRRFTISRKEEDGNIVHILEIRNLTSSFKREQVNPIIKVKINSASKLNDPTLEDWLLTSPGTDVDLAKLQQIKDGIIKFIADDLLEMELDKQRQAFIDSL